MIDKNLPLLHTATWELNPLVLLAMLLDHPHGFELTKLVHQLYTELSSKKDILKECESLRAENENLRDERSRWLQQPDYDSEDCCSYADSLDRESTAKREGYA